MTITFTEALLYAGAMIILFLTPEPVWVALMARSFGHGMRDALPLALGVVIGDFIWPFVAGLLVIIGNPKAILFYMGILLGFFDLRSITLPILS